MERITNTLRKEGNRLLTYPSRTNIFAHENYVKKSVGTNVNVSTVRSGYNDFVCSDILVIAI